MCNAKCVIIGPLNRGTILTIMGHIKYTCTFLSHIKWGSVYYNEEI